tara:strand:+ start:4018 stop:4353 length:336 start_codon:yes stop_codon:yes gene_type:complete
MEDSENKHNDNNNWLFQKESISLSELKSLALLTPNDVEFGAKIRKLLWLDDASSRVVNKGGTSETSIFRKISGSEYKDLVDGYQNKKGSDFTDWWDGLRNDEKVFLSNLFD